jgi:hypothetical protein
MMPGAGAKPFHGCIDFHLPIFRWMHFSGMQTIVLLKDKQKNVGVLRINAVTREKAKVDCSSGAPAELTCRNLARERSSDDRGFQIAGTSDQAPSETFPNDMTTDHGRYLCRLLLVLLLESSENSQLSQFAP